MAPLKAITDSALILTGKKQGAWYAFLSLLVAVGTLMGVKILWPNDRIESVAAQQVRLFAKADAERDSLTRRMNELQVQFSTAELNHQNHDEDMLRRVTTLTILGCSKEPKGSKAYLLAGCPAVLRVEP